MRAGSFGVGERRQLWMVRGATRLLAIYLRGDPYHRVVVEVPDPEEPGQTMQSLENVFATGTNQKTPVELAERVRLAVGSVVSPGGGLW